MRFNEVIFDSNGTQFDLNTTAGNGRDSAPEQIANGAPLRVAALLESFGRRMTREKAKKGLTAPEETSFAEIYSCEACATKPDWATCHLAAEGVGRGRAAWVICGGPFRARYTRRQILRVVRRDAPFAR